jgi:hypothetical protein
MLPLRQGQPIRRLEATDVRALPPGRGAETRSNVREAARIDDLIANSFLSTKLPVRSRLGKVHPRVGSVKVSSQRTHGRTGTRKGPEHSNVSRNWGGQECASTPWSQRISNPNVTQHTLHRHWSDDTLRNKAHARRSSLERPIPRDAGTLRAWRVRAARAYLPLETEGV